MTGRERLCCFCHSPEALPVQRPDLSWAVQCQACAAQGPSAAGAEGAWAAWTHATHGEDLLRTVIDESPDVILLKDWDGKFLLGNRTLARLYGTTPDALVGYDDGAFNPNEEQVAFYLENVRSVMRAGVTETVMETSTDVETGEVRHFQSVKKPLIGPDGSPRILVIAHDVTDIKRAYQAMEERERSYDYAMAAAGEGIWDWNLESNIVTHNVKWCELFGFERDALAHPIEAFTDLLHPADRADVQRVLDEALSGSGSYQHEHRMIRRDGTVLHVLDRGKVVERDSSGRPRRMAGAVTDITERIHADHRLRVTTEALIDANISLETKVEERTAALARANEELRTLAWRDALTGLPNRLAAMDRLASEFARIKRSDVASSILMMDVDQFKPVNDTHGHGAGDDVLRHLATLIRGALRVGDFVARFGGEEFMALLPDTDLAGAMVVAEKIRTTIESSPERTVGRVTISIGAALADATDATMDVAVRRADAALYRAKRSGRNRVVGSEHENTEA
jgi:diguanylate cyclase (GGDEF)-like protein/PAS domain S-box-containing protein